MWIFILLGLFFVGLGIYQLTVDKDELWERQERSFRARGIVNRQRTPEWENAQNTGGWVTVAFGIALMLGSFFLSASLQSSRPNNNSVIQSQCSIDGKPVDCNSFPFPHNK